ncbi:MAG: hypothetical protein COV59_02505 [Candidatus Magasanikbacteria bacterium CG11_big_fil_rev_8_21_14_0_20_39_34]|uniref:Uncharacterized protein n=1 Tax=Candidatus Magasanikbacteria bacterium CG11_big_fil_rev_8_21_14_0_20_39_34 TaxID=1974653 RepID=A0A2H0N562_9BACT|nr:MAG: hypothetical protein COV59_02505 [Candidatus Magasanikbacteria bacterium CG11_big_fil_rev_8_21_14_0_20_39_34]
MFSIKAKNLRVLTFLVLASLLFFCKGASLNMAFGSLAPFGSHSMHSMSHSTDTQEGMDCCGVVGSNYNIDFVSPAALSVLASVVLLGIVFIALVRIFFENGYAEILKVKLRSRSVLFGQGILPKYIALLFQRGILHPKTY